MRAVILAAGCGTRMGGDVPKPLLKVGGLTLILRNMARVSGCSNVPPVVVVGHQAERLMAYLGDRIGALFVHNSRYRETGSLYSLWLAHRVLREPVLVVFADMYIHADLARIWVPPDSVMVASGYDGRGVRLYLNERNRVASASVATEPDPAGARFSGHAWLSQKTLEAMPDVPDFETASLGFGLIGCKAIEVAGPSINVNTPDDLEYARRIHG